MQILQITILIVVNILLLLFRRRLINQTVGTTHHGRRVVIISLIMSALFALFPQRSTLFHLPALHYAQITNFTSGTFRRTTGAALVVLFVMLYLGVRKLPTRSSWMMHLLFGILRLLIRRFVSPLLPGVTMVRVVVAGLEEWLKSGTSNALRDRYHLVTSDILLFGILSALGFAFLENIVYLLHNFNLLDTQLLTSLTATGSLLIKRSISSRVMHICYTGLIARGIYQVRSTKKHRYRLPLGIILGVGLHIFYNIFLVQTNILAILCLLLLSYFFLAWLLYRSDRLYLQTNS